MALAQQKLTFENHTHAEGTNFVFIKLDKVAADGTRTEVGDLAGYEQGRTGEGQSGGVPCNDGELVVPIPAEFPSELNGGDSSGTFDVHIYSLATTNNATSRDHPTAVSEFTFDCGSGDSPTTTTPAPGGSTTTTTAADSNSGPTSNPSTTGNGNNGDENPQGAPDPMDSASVASLSLGAFVAALLAKY